MVGLLEFSSWLMVCFGASLFVAYWITKRQDLSPEWPKIERGDKVTMKSRTGSYLVSVIESQEDRMVVDAPVSKGHTVAIREGEIVRLEIALEDQYLWCRAEVVARDIVPKSLTIKLPKTFSLADRREFRRSVCDPPIPTELNGSPALLMDFSEQGARVVSRCDLAAGDTVYIRLPGCPDPRIGFVLDVIPDIFEGRMGSQSRIIVN